MTSFTTQQEREEDRCEVERLYDESFGGEDRWQRPIYDLRRGHAPVAALCHVVLQTQLDSSMEESVREEMQKGEMQKEETQKSERLVAALRFWEVCINPVEETRVASPAVLLAQRRDDKQPAEKHAEKHALLFGPLAVHASVQGKGLGKTLVERNLAEAKRLGYGGVLISGVAAYYRPFGFRTLCVQGLELPRPSPGHVLMGLEMKPHFLLGAHGKVLPARRRVLPC